jgi:Tol biopolymer transport system component
VWRRVATACLLVTVVVALVSWSGAPAEGAEDAPGAARALAVAPRNLTAGLGPSFRVRADEGFATWYLWDGEDQEIMLYEAATGVSSPITNNDYQDGGDDWWPFIADGYVIWEGRPEEYQEIFLYDIALGTTTRLTNDQSEDAVPWVSAEGAVWQVFDGEDYEIVLYDFSLGYAQTLTDNALDDVYPVIQGGYVTWQGFDGNDWEIFAYSLSDRQIRQVTTNDFDDEKPQMHSGRIVWRGVDGGDADVFLYDLATKVTIQVTDDAAWDDFPQCDGLNVVWTRNAVGAPADVNQVMMYNIATKATTVLRGNAVWHTAPVPHGDRVCWAEETVPGGTMEAYFYDLAQGALVRLTNNQMDDDTPEWDGANWYWDEWYESGGAWEQDVFTTSSAPGQMFVDVSQSDAYYQAVQGMATAGIVGGYLLPGGGREFRPLNPVFRAQFAKMICGAMGIAVNEDSWQDATAPFSDLGPDDPNDLYPHDFVAAAAAAGITQGVRPGEFVPYADIMRAQVITMVVRAAQSLRPGLLAEPPAGFVCAVPPFEGVHWPNLRLAEYNGLLEGLQGYGASWDAWAPMPRGEVAQVLWNLLGMLPR